MSGFQCILDKCPKHNNTENGGCHLWWEIPWENSSSEEIITKKGCILSQEMGLPIVQSVIKAAHTASEHSSVARNSFENGVANIQSTVNYAIEYMEENKDKNIYRTESEKIIDDSSR